MRALALMDADRLSYVRREFLARYAERRDGMIADDPRLMAQGLPETTDVPALDDPTEREARIEALRRQNLERLHEIAG